MDNPNVDTVSEVMMYYSRAQKYCDEWHKQIKHRRALYNMDHYKTRPRQGEERYDDPTYTNTVDLAIGILNEPEFKVHGWSPSMREQKDSDQIEKMLLGLIQINSEREEVLIPYEANLHFVRDGVTVLYSVWDDVIAEMSEISAVVPVASPDPEMGMTVERFDGFSEPPLRTQVIDPLKIFLIPGGPGRWLHVIRVEERPVLDVEMEYGIPIKQYGHLDRDQKEGTKSELLDYWRLAEVSEGGKTRRVIEHAVVFGGTSIKDMGVMEGYDDIPFTLGFFKPIDRADPKGWGHSIIDPMESTITFLEKDVNRRHHLITKWASLPLVFKGMDGRTISMDPSLGSLQGLRPDESLEFPKWEGSPPDIENEMSFLRARAQQSGFSDVLFGSGPSQVSGFALSQMGDQNRIRLEQPIKHLQMLWQLWAKKALRLMAKFGAGRVIRVYGQRKGSEFYEQVFSEGLADYNVLCQIKPEFPNEAQRKHAMATQVKGILSEHTIMQEYLNIDQPGEERKKRLLEMAQLNPAAQQYAMIALLKEGAESGDGAAALALQLIMRQGAGGQQSAPPPQGGMEQLTGLAGPNGQPPPQALGGMAPGQSEQERLGQMADPNMGGM